MVTEGAFHNHHFLNKMFFFSLPFHILCSILLFQLSQDSQTLKDTTVQSTKHKGSGKLHPKTYFQSSVLIYSLSYFAALFVEHKLQLPTAFLLQRFLNTIESKPNTKKKTWKKMVLTCSLVLFLCFPTILMSEILIQPPPALKENISF